MWLEEMLPQDNLEAYNELASATSIPLCVSERLMTRWGFRELLDNGAAQIVMPDKTMGPGYFQGQALKDADKLIQFYTVNFDAGQNRDLSGGNSDLGQLKGSLKFVIIVEP